MYESESEYEYEDQKYVAICVLKIDDNCLQNIKKMLLRPPLIKFDIFANIIKQIMQDGIVINFDSFTIDVVKSKIVFNNLSNPAYVLNNHYPNRFEFCTFPTYSTLLKNVNLLNAGIVDDNTAQIIKDEYKKYMIMKNIKNIKTQITDFLTTQTTFDDTSQFVKVINALDLI